MHSPKTSKVRILGRTVATLLIVLAGFVWPETGLLGQATQGNVRGTVTDATGAVIPGVTVTLTSAETGFSRVVTTDDRGAYIIPQVKPGEYTLKGELPGFKAFLQRGLVVHIQETVEVNIALQVGEVSETVEVTASAPQLNTTSASMSVLIGPKMINELPLNGRNYTQLIFVTGTASERDVNDQSNGAVAGTDARMLSVNGQRVRNNRYTLNGIYNEELMRQTPGISPPIDAIREFTVESHSNSAAADALGAEVNVELKSGTNKIHGAAWNFLRNDHLDANFFFANRANQRKPIFLQNQFGFVLGGPVLKDRVFAFGSYEGFRQKKGFARLSTIPTLAMRRGDFTGLEQIFDPLTTKPNPSGSGLIRDPFPNNQIPENRINPAAKILVDAFYPAPNLPGFTRNLINAKPAINNRDQYLFRFDTKVSDHTQVWYHYGHAAVDQQNPSGLPTVDNLSTFKFDNAGVNLVHTFSPTSILSGRVGWSRVFTTDTPVKPISRKDFFTRAGVSFYQEKVARDSFVGVSIAGLTTGFGGSSDRNRIDNTYQSSLGFEKIQGRHKFTVGTDIRRYLFLIDPPNPQNGGIDFDANLTLDPQNPSGTGSGFASFLLGFPTQVSRGFGDSRTDGRQWGLHFYVQDEWSVTSRLTLNLGLRYQADLPAVDKLNRLGSVDFNPIPGAGAPFAPGSIDGVILFASTNPFTGQPANTRRSIIDPDLNDFAPRVGFAYKLAPTTIVRGGYGVFFDSVRFQELQDMRKQFPFNAQQRLTTNRGVTPDVNFQSKAPFDPQGQIGGWPQNRRNRHGYSEQWNLSVQKQLLADILVEVGYIGSHNLKQIRYYAFNDPRPGSGSPDSRRPASRIGATEIGNNDTNANYHALQLRLNKRFAQGLTFLSLYTYSHAIDDQSNLSDNQIQDGFNTRASRSLASYDLRHNFATSFIYELPIGPGRAVSLSGWQNQILGNWQVQGIARLTSGAPFNISLPIDNANVGSFRRTQRPNLVADPTSGFTRSVDQWFNTAAFSRPAQFTFGNAGRNIVMGDRRTNVDFSLFKGFLLPPLGEEGRLEFRAEFFNLFNHPNFENPSGSFGTGTFGQISNAVPPRDVQLALKVYF